MKPKIRKIPLFFRKEKPDVPKETKKHKIKIKILSLFLLALLVINIIGTSVLAADSYSSSSPQFTAPGSTIVHSSVRASNSWSTLDSDQCGEDFNDIAVQIPPLGCSPMVVRSDLLEEQNVPVFCRLEGLRINPSIDVERISGMRLAGQLDNVSSRYIAGISFHPSRAALRGRGGSTNPISGDMGYAVIVLRQIPTESQMPENVNGNLTAILDYDAGNSFGIGVGEMYVPQLTQTQWIGEYRNYGFWKGRGYVRADLIDENSARFGIYSDVDERISSFSLEKGQSRVVFLPGEYCRAGVEFTYRGSELPKLRAKLVVNDDVLELYEGSRFFNDRCQVLDIDSKGGGIGEVDIRCPGERFSLEIKEYDVELRIGGEGNPIKAYEVGQIFEGITLIYSGKYNEDGEDKPYVVLKKGSIGANSRYDIRRKIEALSDVTSANLEEKIKGVDDKLVVLKLDDEKSVGEGDGVKKVKFFSPATVKDISLTESGASNAEDGRKILAAFEKALEHYEDVDDNYPKVMLESDADRQAGEVALSELIELAKEIITLDGKGNQARLGTLKQLLEKYIQGYPNGKFIEDYKNELASIVKYNSEDASKFTEIDYKDVFIKLDSIKEPSLEEAGVRVFVSGPDDYEKASSLGQGETVLSIKGTRISVSKINKDNIVLSASYTTTAEGTKTETHTLKRGEDKVINQYTVYVSDINYNQVASVSLKPKSYGNSQEVSFPFSIGIEKRAINLSTDAMEANARFANDTIESLQHLNEQLRQGIKVMKTACLLTSVWNSFKDALFSPTSTDARKWAMRGSDGWFNRCQLYVDSETVVEGSGHSLYASVDDCLRKNNDAIEQDIKDIEKIFAQDKETKAGIAAAARKEGKTEQQKEIETWIEDIKKLDTDKVFGGKNVDDVLASIGESYSEVDANDIWELKILLQRYDGTESTKKRIANILDEIDARLARRRKLTKVEGILGDAKKEIVDISGRSEGSIIDAVERKLDTLPDLKAKISIKDKEDPSVVVVTRTETEAIEGGGGTTKKVPKTYLIILNNEPKPNTKVIYGISKTYEIKEDEEVVDAGKDLHFNFRILSKLSYNNAYKDPKIKLYAGGIPALVPFDLQKGWYVATSESAPGAMPTIRESGQVVRYWLGNVGEDGRQGTNDDIRQEFNIYTDVDVYPSLDARETSALKTRAKKALESALLQKGKNPMIIENQAIDVDGFVFKTEDYDLQCQDFMSPASCTWLFRFCDPVVCPSSRCDFGGKMKVDNVIQSGVIGSLILCLPNIKEGVFIPVCLTGLHAGLEGWISIMESYRDCNLEAIKTGKNVGICDELKSVFMCDFFAKHVLSFINQAAKGKLGLYAPIRDAQQDKGGGEYLDPANAIKNAEQSQEYFTTKYAENSKLAFGFKSFDYVGAEICKTFISQSYPTELDGLLDPESPPQFSAFFDETPFSDVTSPATSQYKVYYHIYAGNDSNIDYTVYLTDPPSTPEYAGLQTIIVDSGSILKGENVDVTKDFTAPEGYTKLCVRLAGKDYCGFGRASTGLALGYISQDYIREQATKPAKNAEECVSGVASLSGSLSPNLQAGMESLISPSAEKSGVVRVCSSNNPGKGVNEGRWTPVGVCTEDESIKCWLDENSILENIDIEEIRGKALSEIKRFGLDHIDGLYYKPEAAKKKLNALNEITKNEKNQIKNQADLKKLILDDVEEMLETGTREEGDTSKRLAFDYEQARARLIRARGWRALVRVRQAGAEKVGMAEKVEEKSAGDVAKAAEIRSMLKGVLSSEDGKVIYLFEGKIYTIRETEESRDVEELSLETGEFGDVLSEEGIRDIDGDPADGEAVLSGTVDRLEFDFDAKEISLKAEGEEKVELPDLGGVRVEDLPQPAPEIKVIKPTGRAGEEIVHSQSPKDVVRLKVSSDRDEIAVIPGVFGAPVPVAIIEQPSGDVKPLVPLPEGFTDIGPVLQDVNALCVLPEKGRGEVVCEGGGEGRGVGAESEVEVITEFKKENRLANVDKKWEYYFSEKIAGRFLLCSIDFAGDKGTGDQLLTDSALSLIRQECSNMVSEQYEEFARKIGSYDDSDNPNLVIKEIDVLLKNKKEVPYNTEYSYFVRRRTADNELGIYYEDKSSSGFTGMLIRSNKIYLDEIDNKYWIGEIINDKINFRKNTILADSGLVTPLSYLDGAKISGDLTALRFNEELQVVKEEE